MKAETKQKRSGNETGTKRKPSRREIQLAQSLERTAADNRALITRVVALEEVLRAEQDKRERHVKAQRELSIDAHASIVRLENELAAERNKSLWRRAWERLRRGESRHEGT